MIKFKVMKYKHYKRAQAIYADLREDGDGGEVLDSIVLYAIGLVKEWDFVNEDTGEALPPGEDAMDELSMEQFKELFSTFNRTMGFTVRLVGDDGAEASSEAEASDPG